MPRRSYGSGSLSVYRDARGRETWVGQWFAGSRHLKRRIGRKRQSGERDGLTKPQAERELRRLMATASPAAAPGVERLDLGVVGERYLAHLRVMGRKPSTLEVYASMLEIHVAPAFSTTAIERIDTPAIETFIARQLAGGCSPKTVRNQLGLLHSIFTFACKHGWASQNPCVGVERPRDSDRDAGIRFLDLDELDAVLRAVPDGWAQRTERTLYLTAAMSGLRMGELLGLRWCDVDWTAARLRVRRSFVRGQFGSPKSKRSSRAVPLADALARELERHFKESNYQGDEDLVFCHPRLGNPLDRSRVLKRFQAAARRAGVGRVRFHDLRHTFGTRMAAHGVPMRTLQEWMGHRDFATTLIYSDYAPSAQEAEWVEAAFAPPSPAEVAR